MQSTHNEVTVDFLAEFSAAWNRHDLDALMKFMSDDCPDACGTRHEGMQAVKTAFESAWINFPDAQWLHDRHFVNGNFGVSEWTFTGTASDGTRVEADGVDIFTFKDGKIQLKNVFRKNRPNLPAAK
jgi:ketosteroid isomerase-like protein